MLKKAKNIFESPVNGSARGIEVVSIDRGLGMENIGRAFQDGHSTAESSGTGLGAIGRMASDFDMHSLPDRGTAFMARV